MLAAVHAGAADPAAPNPKAAAQNRTEPNAAGAREARENPNRKQGEARANRATGQPGHLDSELAACLIIGNHKEIAISRLAEQSQNEEVKKFAQQMIQDHEKFASELQKFAEQGGFMSQQLAVDAAAHAGDKRPTSRDDANRAQPRTTAQPDRTRDSDAARGAARSEALDQQGNAHEMLNIEREVAQQSVQSAQKEMSSKQGAEADQCYIGMQVGAHMNMVDKLEVFARHASPELQAVLQQGLQTAQQHLEHAKKIHKSLEGKEQASAQPARQN
jgi:predicted outer membrane protein